MKKELFTTVRNVKVSSRQFGEMVKSISGTSDKITLAANYAIAQIYDHGNKDKLIQLFKSPAFNLAAGGLNKLGKEVLGYIRAHYPAVTRTDAGEFKINPKKAQQLVCPKAMCDVTGHSFTLSFDQWRQLVADKPKADTSDKPLKAATVIKQVEALDLAFVENRFKGSDAEKQALASLLFAQYDRLVKELAKVGITELPATKGEKQAEQEKTAQKKAATKPAALKVVAGPAPESLKQSAAEKRKAKKEAAERAEQVAKNAQLDAERAEQAQAAAAERAEQARAASALDAEMAEAHKRAVNA